MKIIGEKINGTRKMVAQAISERNTSYIQKLAIKQTEAGASWLDVNAGTHPHQELNDLTWLIDTIQDVVPTPLSLDSANPHALKTAVTRVSQTPMINSINGDPERLHGILPIVADKKCQVIALAMEKNRIPETAHKRMEVIHKVIDATRGYGIPDNDIYIDPLVTTLSVNIKSGLVAFETMQMIRDAYPQVPIVVGLSNISFGLPARSQINRSFLTIAMWNGLDCAILDPLDRELMAAIISTNLVLGADKHCLNFTRAFRNGLFDTRSQD